MNLESKVIFTCKIYQKTSMYEATFLRKFKTLEELKDIIKENCISEIPYSLDITRSIIVFDHDVKSKWIDDKFINVADEKLTFIVADKLMYPRDIREYSIKKYGGVFNNFEQSVKDEKLPMKFSVYNTGYYKFYNIETGQHISAPKTHIEAAHLTQDDIVIDKNLNQIWFEKTGEVPTVLTEMLSRTKEIIR